MSNSKKATVEWFHRDDSDWFMDRSIATSGVDGSSLYPSAAPRSTSAGRSASAPRARSLRLVAASLAGPVGIGAVSFDAVSTRTGEVAPSSVSVSSRSLVYEASVLTLGRPAPSDQSAKRETSKAAQRRDLKVTIQELVDAGYPGTLAAKADEDGSTAGATARKGNLSTGEAPPFDGEVRIRSSTKTFVAVVIMKVVEEGKVKLGEPIETYLPDLIKGQDVDSKKITVRQLLQHTSGLPKVILGMPDFFAMRNDYLSPRDVLDMALTKPTQFAPETKFTYTNTNYIVLGLLAERVDKRPVAKQTETKTIKPLGLKHAYMPGPGEEAFRGKHPYRYHTCDNKPDKLEDITEAGLSWTWAAGPMIPTPNELNKFVQSIFDGSLLSQMNIAEMKKLVPMNSGDNMCGLGLIGHKLSCSVAWGHGGTIPGSQTDDTVGLDEAAAAIATTTIPATNAKGTTAEEVGGKRLGLRALSKALCGK